MKTLLNILQHTIVIFIIALNSYAIAYGLRISSLTAVLFSLGSLAALGYCIHLVKKLKALESEEEYDGL